MATDEELVDQIRHGQREAYTELFRKHYASVYAICLSIVKNPQDAEEIAQDMFVHAYLKLEQLRNPAKFLPWLKKMALNRSRNYVQRDRARVITLPFADLQRWAAGPDEEFLRQELIHAITEAVEALPIKDRLVVKARIDGLSHAEISRRFNMPYRASLSRLYRARKKLAEHLKELRSTLGLPAMRSFIRQIDQGGVAVMKIGVGAKVTIGVICALVAGFIALRIGMYDPDAGAGKSAGQQQEVRSETGSGVDQNATVIPKLHSQQPENQGSVQGESDTDDVQDGESAQIARAIAWLDSLEGSPQAETKPGSPTEIMSRYLKLINSAEYRAEARSILITSRREQIAYMKRVEELEDEEKRIKQDLESASHEDYSSSQKELEKVRHELQETKIDLAREIILQDDAIHKLSLRHFTIDQIQIARQEIAKNAPAFLPFEMSAGGKELITPELRTEAMKRLRAVGWTPAMPETYYY